MLLTVPTSANLLISDITSYLLILPLDLTKLEGKSTYLDLNLVKIS